MAWSQTLLDASFRGVQFDAVAADDSFARALQLTEYPYRNGAQVDDLGGGARRIRIQAVFWGDAYETKLTAFVAALGRGGEGELVHPVFGSLKVHAASWSVPHRAEDPDYTLVAVEFVEAGIPVALFAKVPAQSRAAAIQSAIDRVEAAADAVFARQVGVLAAAAANGRERTILSGALAAITSAVRLLSPSAILSSLPGIEYPLAWAADLRAVAAAMRAGTRLAAELEAYAPATLFADFFGLAGLFEGWPVADVQRGAYAARVKTTVDAQAGLTPTLEISRAAADVLAQEAVSPTLSPVELGRIADDARARLQAAIDAASAAYGLADGRPLVEALRDAAHAVLDAARAVIEARPPIVLRTVDADTNLHRLAHLWYADWRRADELLRLNPQLNNPNFVAPGAVLNAYAA
jgi:prophage DNA circulation protein